MIDRITLSPRFEILAGARYDNVDFEDASDRAPTRDASSLSPLGGLVFKPVPAVSLYASAGLGFAPPSIQVVGPRDPEESPQLEGGVKLSFLAGKGYAGAAVYQLERENIAVPDSTGLSRQSGSQRSRGFELEAERRAEARLRRARALRLHLGRAHGLLRDPPARARLRRARPQGNVPAFAPRHIASFWGTTPLGHGFSLGAGLRYVSEQFVAPDNRNVIDGYALCEGAVFYARGLVRVGVHLRNLTGTEYATRGFGSDSAIPGRPFEAMARVELGFGRR